MRQVPWNRHLLFWTLAVGGCAVDLVSKSWIFARLGMPQHSPTEWIWQPIFGFTTSLNEGALFGIGQGQVVLFGGLSILAAAAIVYWLFWVGAARDALLAAALGCVMAGIFGNLYDRLGLPGLQWDRFQTLHPAGSPVYAVRDWLNFELIHWPIFNIADSLLVFGAGLMLWHAYRSESHAGPSPKLSNANSASGSASAS